eukprot:5106085-Prymnesium_polylepis.1
MHMQRMRGDAKAHGRYRSQARLHACTMRKRRGAPDDPTSYSPCCPLLPDPTGTSATSHRPA